jgi:hypothetical protein
MDDESAQSLGGYQKVPCMAWHGMALVVSCFFFKGRKNCYLKVSDGDSSHQNSCIIRIIRYLMTLYLLVSELWSYMRDY